MNFNSRFFISTFVATGTILLSACSTEEPESGQSTENKAPAIFVQSQNSTDEGKTIEIGFNVNDDRTPYADLNIQLVAEGLQGNASLNQATKKIIYNAPFLSGSSKQLTESFTLRATDKEGLRTEQRVIVTVTDINSPVEVKSEVPSGAFGYQNTISDKTINAFLFNDSPMTHVDFLLFEDPDDSDLLSIDFTVNGLFKNQVNLSSSDGGDLIRLSFETPNLTSPSMQLKFTLTAEDNDGKDAASVNLTLVKRHALGFDNTKSSPYLSEKAGGEIYFMFSEPLTYPGDFSVSITDEKGAPLAFTLPFAIDKDLRKITFSPSSGILGDRNIFVNLSHTVTVQNAAGERYDNVTTLQKQILIKDDRDDDFLSLIDSFKSHAAQASEIIRAREELLIARSLSNQLLLNNAVRFSRVDELLESVAKELTEQAYFLDEKERQINSLIGSGKVSEANFEILQYISQVENLGKPARQVMLDWYNEHVQQDLLLGVKKPSLSWSSRGLEKSNRDWSHYIGNLDYGFHDVARSGVWQFKNEYSYLSVLKENRTFCI